MTSHIRTVIGKALKDLKNGNVLAATALIKRSLGIVTDTKPASPASAKPQAEARSVVDDERPASKPKFARPGLFDHLIPKISTRSTPGVEESRTTPNFKSRTYHSNAGSVPYKLYIPATLPDTDRTLVLMLHGCKQNPDDFARGTGMNALADEYGIIVAYPQQPRTANIQGCWNWFDDRHQHRGSGEPVLLAGLAQELAREFRVGNGRTFAAGLSAGGAMADVLASTYPDVFAAVGIHSGLPSGAASNMMSAFAAMNGSNATAIPAAEIAGEPFVRKIIFHGDADTTVSETNGAAILARSRTQLSDVEEIAKDETVNGRRVTRITLQRPEGQSLVEHWIVHGSGHAWTGGRQGGSYVDPKGPDASREMVRFFLNP